MSGVLKKIKQSKRRIVQQTKQKIGMAEASSRDVDYDFAVENFHVMDKQITEVLKNLKDVYNSSSEAASKRAALARSLAAIFNSNEDPNDPMRKHAEEFVEACQNSASVQAACAQVLENKVHAELSKQTVQKYSTIKKQIQEHDGLRIDVESYHRRCKNMQARGKTDSDPELQKLLHKFGRANSSFKVMHPTLMTALRTSYEARHNLLVPHFISILAAIEKMEADASANFKTALDSLRQSYEIEDLLQDFDQLTMMAPVAKDMVTKDLDEVLNSM